MTYNGTIVPKDRISMPDYTVTLRLNSDQIEVTIPSDLVEFHEFEGGEAVAFVPKLRDGHIEFGIFPGNGGWSHERKLKQVGKYDQTILRFPKEFAVERGLFHRVKREDEVELKIETNLQKELNISTDPPMKPVEYPDSTEKLAEPYFSILHENEGANGQQLQFAVRQSWADKDVLDLDGGERFATRLSVRNDDLVLVLDLDVKPDQYDQTNVRTFFSHDLSSIEGVDDEYTQIRSAFSKAFAHGLDLARPTEKKTSLKVWPEPNRLVMKRSFQSQIYWFY